MSRRLRREHRRQREDAEQAMADLENEAEWAWFLGEHNAPDLAEAVARARGVAHADASDAAGVRQRKQTPEVELWFGRQRRWAPTDRKGR